MGRKKAVRNAKRVTIYMDAELEWKMRVLSKRLGMTLSSATRLLYVISLSFGRIADDVQQWLLEIQTVYPDGVPEEEAVTFIQRLMEHFFDTTNRWGSYTHALLVGAGFPGVDPEPPQTKSAKQMMEELGARLAGMQTLGALLRGEELDLAGPTAGQGPRGPKNEDTGDEEEAR